MTFRCRRISWPSPSDLSAQTRRLLQSHPSPDGHARSSRYTRSNRYASTRPSPDGHTRAAGFRRGSIR